MDPVGKNIFAPRWSLFRAKNSSLSSAQSCTLWGSAGFFFLYKKIIWSNQLATSHEFFYPKWFFFLCEIPCFQGSLGWWYHNLARIMGSQVTGIFGDPFPKPDKKRVKPSLLEGPVILRVGYSSTVFGLDLFLGGGLPVRDEFIQPMAVLGYYFKTFWGLYTHFSRKCKVFTTFFFMVLWLRRIRKCHLRDLRGSKLMQRYGIFLGPVMYLSAGGSKTLGSLHFPFWRYQRIQSVWSIWGISPKIVHEVVLFCVGFLRGGWKWLCISNLLRQDIDKQMISNIHLYLKES